MDAADAARRWVSVWQRAWEAKDVRAIVALYAPNARHWSSPFRQPGIGPAGVQAYVQGAFDDESEVRAWFGLPVVEGDEAAVPWWATMMENGQEITLAGTSLLRFDPDGLVVSQWDAWNQADGRREPPAGWARGAEVG